MKIAAAFIIGVYIILTALIIGTDIFTSVIERYSHFHIGQWSNTYEWKNAVMNVCIRWALKTPILRLKKDCRYLLLDQIRGVYGKAMVQSWQKAGCVLGLQEVGYSKVQKKIKAQVLDTTGDWVVHVNKIDYAMLAYSLLKKENPDSIQNAMDHMAQCIEANLCQDGMISYSGGKEATRRYVDTLGFVCPFLARYGKVYHKPRYIEIAVDQIRLFRQKGMIRGLPVHCFETENDYPIGVCGWGRGTGWFALGIIDLYIELENDCLKEMLKGWIRELAHTSRQFELSDGGFSTILPAKNAYDSSATAMLGYFFARCGEILSDSDYTELAARCQKRLMRVTKINGVVDECQGDTIDIGIFSERFASMPFVQGMALRLAAVLDNTTGE